MPNARGLHCSDEARRTLLDAQSTYVGVDYIEIPWITLDDQRFLHVYLLGSINLSPWSAHPEWIQIEGGVRVQGIQVLGITVVLDHLIVETDQPGDFSTYTLVIKHPDADPVHGRCDFTFKAGCPSDFDCDEESSATSKTGEEPVIDYMAKDYASFRQALIDFASGRIPEWEDRHEADLWITLIEILAYTGDRLSYFQDAVANEAYLETARRRISVRRHARLLDYHLSDGVSARVFLCFEVDRALRVEPRTLTCTKIDQPIDDAIPGAVLPAHAQSEAEELAEAFFETIEDLRAHPSLNEISIYTWGDEACCLPVGTASLDLDDDLAYVASKDAKPGAKDRTNVWRLRPGSLLVLEEVRGPKTGSPADADPAHRQVVRLTSAKPIRDELRGADLTHVEWDPADALTFPLCLSAMAGGAGQTSIRDISLARGNCTLADHGLPIEEETHAGPETPTDESLRRPHRFWLDAGPLSFRAESPGSDPIPVARLESDDLDIIPQVVSLRVNGETIEWDAVRDLLDSGSAHHHFVAETDNDGRALLRFGNDENGKAPSDNAEITVDYRIGVGTDGNVGAEAISHVFDSAAKALQGVTGIRNPLPAWGGVDPETLDHAKATAPVAFRSSLLRAVTEDDYATCAEMHPDVARAVATFRWTGSWHTVFVAIDPVGRTDLETELQREIRDWILRFALAGYDIEIDPPTFVPLDIELRVCVDREHFRADVEQAVLETLGNETTAAGANGYFHPDQFTFGQPLLLSDLCAVVEQIDGVDSVEPTKLQRYGGDDEDAIQRGRLTVDRLEILRLDRDPNYPENGTLELTMLGGKR